MNAFPLFQAHVATRLGISEQRVRELRLHPQGPLKEGRDWMKQGSRLLFALSAVDRIAAALALPKPVALLAWPEMHRIVVAHLWPNPGYVGGCLLPSTSGTNGFGAIPEGAPVLRVAVRSSRNLVPGMVLDCVYVGGVYQATKLPRKKGAW